LSAGSGERRRFMSRTLALGLVLFGILPGASAQPPNARIDEAVPRDGREAQAQQQEEQQRRARQAALVLQQRRELELRVAQLERLTFQQHGDASRARQQLDSLLAAQIKTIHLACKPTDSKKKQLKLDD